MCTSKKGTPTLKGQSAVKKRHCHADYRLLTLNNESCVSAAASVCPYVLVHHVDYYQWSVGMLTDNQWLLTVCPTLAQGHVVLNTDGVLCFTCVSYSHRNVVVAYG
jgi:hypothetical protein